jgi:hypothetical protein
MAAKQIREMTEELKQYLIWSGQADLWDEIQRERNAVVARRKAQELAEQRERERLAAEALKRRKELGLLAMVTVIGGIILYNCAVYIYNNWPR